MVQYCRKCGKELTDDAEFCDGCGFNLNGNPTQNQTPAKPNSTNRNELYTDFAFTWKYKIFAASAKYHAYWLETPVLQNKHTISVNLAVQSQKGLWGASLDTAYMLDSPDKPVFSLEGYVQASSAVRIVLSVNDVLKLLGAEERMYAGQYVSNSGNASLAVKFLF